MKATKMLFAVACLLGLVASSFAQNVSKKTPGIQGYLDPKTGAFRILPTPDDDSVDLPLTVTGGSATASLVDVATSNFIEEQAAVLATRSGSTATCTVTIPYSWNLASASSDKVSLTYSIDAPVEATANTAFPERLRSQSVATISVPANGATTNESITATF